MNTVTNCYSAPVEFLVNSTSYPGLFIRSSTQSLNNCYYFNATGSSGCGYGQFPSDCLFAKSEEELKSSAMVTIGGALGTSLNFNLDDPVWVQDGCYPTHKQRISYFALATGNG